MREKFRNLRREEERFAPSFERDWRAARARLEGRRRAPRPRLVVAAVLLCAFGAVLTGFVATGERGGEGRTAAPAPAPANAPPTTQIAHDPPVEPEGQAAGPNANGTPAISNAARPPAKEAENDSAGDPRRGAPAKPCEEC